MYNALKNKIDTYFFNRHVSGSYDKISEVENEEEVYCHKNKLAVVVKDEEVGKRIYDIVKTFKEKELVIETLNAKFRITKYISDRENTVQVFYINFTLKNDFWGDLDDIQKLKELVSFVNVVKENGYIIDKSVFDYKKCDQIAALLSFFKPIEVDEEDENECIIEYIHYILSKGKDLNAFYQDIVNKGLVDSDIFPYKYNVLKMFYQYFKTKRFKEDILTVLNEEELENKRVSNNLGFYPIFGRHDYLLFDENNLKINSKVVEEKSQYTVYDNIKIYHNVSKDKFSKFMSDMDRDRRNLISENIVDDIYNLDRNIIGHKFEISNTFPLVVDQEITSQTQIINFIRELARFCSSRFCSFRENYINKGVKVLPPEENEFEIEKSLTYGGKFRVKEVIDLYNLYTCDGSELKIQITEIFFKLFLKYLKNKYNDFSNEEQFFKINEIRYLNPVLVREFINYSLGKAVNYIQATEELYLLIDGSRAACNLNSKFFCYDPRFIYSPDRVSYLFDYEVKQKYGIEIKDEELGQTFAMPDGRRLVTFPSNTKKVSEVESSERTLRNAISDKFDNFYGDVKIVGINEIIYKKSIKNGVYEFIGYVTDSIKGNKLTDDFLVTLSNKDFLKVAGVLFTKFDSECIPLETIYMDENNKFYKFYIDIHDRNCLIKRSQCRVSRFREGTTYIYWIINELMAHPNCNRNTFIDFKQDDYAKRRAPSRSTLLRLALSYDAYCEEHGIYFDSTDKMCPICHKTKYFVDYHSFSNNVIFEDKYARHFRLDSNFNLKIYKKTKVDVAALEEKVTEMMSEIDLNPAAPIKIYHQECFMPYKKAINSHNKFIGYVYKAVDFDKKSGDGSCISLKDLKNMSNLPRIKALIRLISQTRALVSEGKGFIKNPFDNVFLVKGYSKQVQFVNIEFISKQANLEDTLNWNYRYVFEAVDADKDIEIKLLDCQNALDIALRDLRDLSKRLTKYCSLHNMYYEDKFLFCPKCIPESDVKNAEVIPVEPSAIFTLKQINEGGESFIYDYDGNSVVKVFKETEINVNLKSKIIAKLLSKKELLNEINRENKINGVKYRYIIPDKLFLDKNSNNVFAYLMEKVENAKPISTLRDKSQVEALGLTKQDVFEILITIGEGIETLHKRAGIYIGDLNGRNILFDTKKNVYFLDFDGMGIDEIAPEFCTDGYIDPISKKKNNITMKDDWYSFAVQAFYYLTYTHPFNGVYYLEEDINRVALEITEKMERRISLLGNHGMKPPSVAESWNWMNAELENSFLTIFEGNNRKSIVPLLKKQYKEMYGNISEPTKVKVNIRVNSKFIAKKLPIFDGEVTNVINHFSAVYKDENGEYCLTILGKDGKSLVNVSLFDYYKNIIDVILSDDEKFAFVIFNDTVVILDVEGNTQICTKKISDPNNVVVNASTLYFNLDNIIHELTFDSHKLVKEQKIKFLTEYEMKKFYVQSNSKFVQIKRNLSEKVDKIYCNSELLCNVNYNSEATDYNIIYDEITKFWLVVNSDGNVVCINANNGSYEQVNIPTIDDFNMDNLTFYNGNIYVPDEDYLYIVSVNNQYATKKMECHSIMTPDSKVCSVNNDGFNVIANNSIYEVRRG